MSTAVFPQRFSFFTACLVLFLTGKTQLVHRLSGAAAICLGNKGFFRGFEEKLTRRVKLKRLIYIAKFKIDFLLLFSGCKKVLIKMSALGVSRQIIFSQWFSLDMIDDKRDALCKELFCCCCCCCCCCCRYFLSCICN